MVCVLYDVHVPLFDAHSEELGLPDLFHCNAIDEDRGVRSPRLPGTTVSSLVLYA